MRVAICKVLGCFWQTSNVIQNKWYGNPRYILLSGFWIWCYQVDTFPNLAVLPKMVLKSWQWKSQSCPIWMVWLVPYAKFWGESEYQDPRSWFFLCILQYPKWCGGTRIRSDDHLRFGWFKLHIDWFFKEIEVLVESPLYGDYIGSPSGLLGDSWGIPWELEGPVLN